jgi:cytochrome c-type biogenesis protein CcmH
MVRVLTAVVVCGVVLGTCANGWASPEGAATTQGADAAVMSDEARERLDAAADQVYQQVLSPFCPGRALSDCPSQKAHDLKAEIRGQLAQGESAAAVLAGVFARYGDQYRAVPGYAGFGLVAWLGPALFLVVGAVVALRMVRRGAARGAVAAGDAAASTGSSSGADGEPLPESVLRAVEREVRGGDGGA